MPMMSTSQNKLQTIKLDLDSNGKLITLFSSNQKNLKANNLDMLLDEKKLYTHLLSNNYSFELFSHNNFYKVSDAQEFDSAIPGHKTKNLFVKDKKGNYFLFCLWDNTKIALNKVYKYLDKAQSRLSFCNSYELLEILDITPGSVNPFCITSIPKKSTDNLTFILDIALTDAKKITSHPYRNDRSICLLADDFCDIISKLTTAKQIKFQTIKGDKINE